MFRRKQLVPRQSIPPAYSMQKQREKNLTRWSMAQTACLCHHISFQQPSHIWDRSCILC